MCFCLLSLWSDALTLHTSSYHPNYTYEVFMKCYEVFGHLFMHITYCFCVTYDENMKCWGVARIFLLQILKISLHSSQDTYNMLIYSVIYMWRVFLTLHISSLVFTIKSCFKLCKMLFPMFQCFSNSSNMCIAYSRMSIVSDVKCCEDLWRGKISLHVVNEL